MVPQRTRGLSRTESCIPSSVRSGRHHVYTELEPSPWRRLSRQVFTFGAALLGLFTVSTLLQQQRQRWRQQQQQPYAARPEALAAKSIPPQAAAAAAANISLWNSYSLDETFRLDRLYPWSYLAEPHKTSVLMIDTLEDGFEASVR